MIILHMVAVGTHSNSFDLNRNRTQQGPVGDLYLFSEPVISKIEIVASFTGFFLEGLSDVALRPPQHTGLGL